MRSIVRVGLTSALVALLMGAVTVSAQRTSACWGQASAVFAHDGFMGQHASSFETPRLGLRNLARTLYDQDVITDDSMQALGAFVAAELGYTIEACG